MSAYRDCRPPVLVAKASDTLEFTSDLLDAMRPMDFDGGADDRIPAVFQTFVALSHKCRRRLQVSTPEYRPHRLNIRAVRKYCPQCIGFQSEMRGQYAFGETA